MNTLKKQLHERERGPCQGMTSREQELHSQVEALQKRLEQVAKTPVPSSPVTACVKTTALSNSVPAPPAPPPPPPPGKGPPLPPGLAPPPPNSQPVPIRQPYQTKYKLPVFNWNILRNQQLKNTVFVSMNDQALIDSLDMGQFEEIFRLSDAKIDGEANGTSLNQGNTLKKTASVSSLLAKKAEKVSLLDTNRHRSVLRP
ncbi:Formin-like protein 1 [Cichlidogyrus casuarinus]|uniref:Formin-like protein 1 n=1 Tax=Cichlidogyrus casuarinus TaxID=1844966 RepID=A0ABD2PRH3_9PLAT